MLFHEVAAIHNLMRQQSSLFKRLEVIESMRVFFTQWLDENEELRAQLERTESDLVAAQKAISDGERLLNKTEEEKEVAKAEARRMGEEKEVVEAKCKDVEQEKDQLKKELGDLWAVSEAQKKELEEL